MAGQRTLNPYVLVRLQCPQPEFRENRHTKWRFFWLTFKKFGLLRIGDLAVKYLARSGDRRELTVESRRPLGQVPRTVRRPART